jgi:uncharacterized LabA/DUF88 family protein
VPSEPTTKRAVAFVDGQNLFHAAKEAFGYPTPSFDVVALARAVCALRSWHLTAVRFYTGVPDSRDNPFWNHFWTAKLAQMGREGVQTYSRPLRYRNQTVRLPGGVTHTMLVAQEKGIDVRLALDVVRMAHARAFDVAVVFSQDQDLSEVADELKVIVGEQKRWIRMASAFPSSPTSRNTGGVNHTEWITIDRTTYDACLDARDYRPRRAPRA